jgi:orotate phosphoribosyltransferase
MKLHFNVVVEDVPLQYIAGTALKGLCASGIPAVALLQAAESLPICCVR